MPRRVFGTYKLDERVAISPDASVVTHWMMQVDVETVKVVGPKKVRRPT
jgi:hypothetical protein